jgi:UDP-glucuronate decarboxylase
MNILITGGAGFVGSHLCKKFINEGHKVFCLDNLFTGSKKNIADLLNHENFVFLLHDVIEPIELNDIDQIYHLACAASPKKYQSNPIHTTKTSVMGTLNMLDLALKNNAKILFTSTSEVYGDPLVHPQREDYWGNVNPVGIRSCYDEGKRCAESLCMDYNRTYGLEVRIVRIFNTYGPFMDPEDGRVVSNFINQALKNEDFTVYGDGEQTRSFQYIDDLVKGLVSMMNNTKKFIGPVNLGNPDEFTVNELSQLVSKLIPESTSKTMHKELPKDDPVRRKPDISLAKEKLNWKPEIKLEEGLIKTIEYFRNIQ